LPFFTRAKPLVLREPVLAEPDCRVAVALLVARLLVQRLNVATTYLADIIKQYAGHGDHLAVVGEILQSMINLPPIKISPGSDRQSDSRL
jgi:CRP/FNR family cyclic AMP-dependent transcriptional regulator